MEGAGYWIIRLRGGEQERSGDAGVECASMRPQILNPLFASVSALSGIGPKMEKLFARLIARDGEPPRIIDLLFHLPTGFVDRRNQPKLSDVPPDTGGTGA